MCFGYNYSGGCCKISGAEKRLTMGNMLAKTLHEKDVTTVNTMLAYEQNCNKYTEWPFSFLLKLLKCKSHFIVEYVRYLYIVV